MKALILLLLLPLAAQAATSVTLDAERCANTGECFNVQNNGGLTVDYLQISCGAGCVSVSLNGVRYSSGLNGVNNTPVNGIISVQDAALYASDGSQVTLSFDASKKASRCGKYACPNYALLDGTVAMP